MFRLGERVEHYYDGGESEHGARLNVRKKDVRIIYDPRFPIPEMTTANKYIKQLGWVGTQLLTLYWACARPNSWGWQPYHMRPGL